MDARLQRARTALAEGRALAGLMLQEIRDDFIVRLVAASGFDLVIVDMEHGTYELRDVARIAQLCRLTGLVTLVRPPALDYPWIARALDAGADGIMAPRVASAADVRRTLEAMKYPPDGARGMAGQRGHSDYLPVGDRRAFAASKNLETLLVVQIELAAAVDAVDSILAVPGVDVALVGPSDLMVSMGVDSPADERLEEAIGRVVDAGRASGVPTGLQVGDPEALRRWRGAGMQLLVLATDIALVSRAVLEAGARLRELVEGPGEGRSDERET
jgi:2-keto-3-deoxy-L-rhamnonate aldolase RhmA